MKIITLISYFHISICEKLNEMTYLIIYTTSLRSISFNSNEYHLSCELGINFVFIANVVLFN